MDPYFVLQVPLESDDAAIRAAYLTAIQAASPETDPIRFQEISSAYEKIKTAPRRRHFEFERTVVYDNSPVGTVRQCLSFHPPPKPPAFEFLKQHLRDCLKRSRP